MGLYIRKGFNFGPLRLNLSKSGLGASFGVKGARVGIGPRGSYVHVGRGGLYFRENLGGGRRPLAAPATGELSEVESVPLDQLRGSSADELLDDLNRVQAYISRFPIVLICAVVVLGLLAFQAISVYQAGLQPRSAVEVPRADVLRDALLRQAEKTKPVWLWWSLGALAVAVGSVPLLARLRRLDQQRGRLIVRYDLEPNLADMFTRLRSAFEEFAACGAVWHVQARGATDDWKRQAGAGVIVKRRRVEPRISLPPRVQSPLEVPMLSAGRQTLYFFPDRLMVLDSGGFAAVPYPELEVEAAATRFVEDDHPPADAEVVGRTWRYVNRDGGPDRRFRSNEELPVVRYGELRLKSASGLNELFQCSRPEAVGQLKAAIGGMANRSEGSRDSDDEVLPRERFRSDYESSLARIQSGVATLSALLADVKAGRWEGLYESAKHAYELIPTAYALYYRGVAAARQEKYAEAEPDLLMAYQQRQHPHAWLEAEIERLRLVLGEDITQAFEPVNGLEIPESELVHNLAVVYFKTDRFREAREWSERAIQDPKFRQPGLKILTMALHRLGDFDEALRTAGQLYDETTDENERGDVAAHAACSAARLHDDASVRKWVALAVEAGYDKQKLRSEPDLAEYIAKPEIQTLLN